MQTTVVGEGSRVADRLEVADLDRVRRGAALTRASVAFLDRWEREGGRGLLAARRALLAVFQFESTIVLEQALDVWRGGRWTASERPAA